MDRRHCIFCNQPIGEIGFHDIPAHKSCYLLGHRDEKLEIKREALMSNRYRVPRKQWKKWSDLARTVFNNLYATLKASQGVLHHPSVTELLSRRQWDVVAWNTAWLAADEAQKAIENS